MISVDTDLEVKGFLICGVERRFCRRRFCLGIYLGRYMSLTAVFEMGTGVPSPLLSPDLSLENYSSLHVLFLQKPLVKLSTY